MAASLLLLCLGRPSLDLKGGSQLEVCPLVCRVVHLGSYTVAVDKIKDGSLLTGFKDKSLKEDCYLNISHL